MEYNHWVKNKSNSTRASPRLDCQTQTKYDSKNMVFNPRDVIHPVWETPSLAGVSLAAFIILPAFDNSDF